MARNKSDVKGFHLVLPQEIWRFLKITSATHDESMSEIIIKCLKKYKKKLESKLTDKDINV